MNTITMQHMKKETGENSVFSPVLWQRQKDLNPRHAVLEWMWKNASERGEGAVLPNSRRKPERERCWIGAVGKFQGPKRAKSSQAQYDKNSAGVMIAGCVMPDSRKSLSPVRSTSALAWMAARRMGRSFTSRI